MERSDLEYVGFWPRVGASMVDTILVGLICYPLATAVYGSAYWTDAKLIHGPGDFLLTWVFPAVAVVLFWVTRQATPGKMAIGATIVDARTGGPLTVGQGIGRYLGYYVSILPLFLGLFWVGFDSRKQGWHDKLAGTVVVRSKSRAQVRFDG